MHWQLYINLLFTDCLVLKATVQTVAVHDLFWVEYNQKMTWFTEGVICELFWTIFWIFSTDSLKKVICSQTGHHGFSCVLARNLDGDILWNHKWKKIQFKCFKSFNCFICNHFSQSEALSVINHIFLKDPQNGKQDVCMADDVFDMFYQAQSVKIESTMCILYVQCLSDIPKDRERKTVWLSDHLW